MIRKSLRQLKKFFFRLLAPRGEDLITYAYQEAGILNFGDEETTGERYALEQVVRQYLPKNAVIFDVGANVGHYSELLCDLFPDARIFSFEPNPKVCTALRERVAGRTNVTVEEYGLGAENGSRATLYSFAELPHSELGTMRREALALYDVEDKIDEMEVGLTTVDAYCGERAIPRVHFLKIDVEGYELAVLEGAREMLARNAIDLIQFEFNEGNIFSRVFLKDFYEILHDYDLYRIKDGGLLALREYRTINEIFKYQNILAVRKDINKGIC